MLLLCWRRLLLCWLLLLLSLLEPCRDTVKPRGDIYRIRRPRGVDVRAFYVLIPLLQMTTTLQTMF